MDLMLFLLLVALGGYLIALATLPRWSFMTINRSHIWCLRDELDAAVRAGVLPSRHPAVQMARDEVTVFLNVLPSLTPRSMRLAHDLVDRDLVRERARQREDAREGLTAEQKEILDQFRSHLMALLGRSMVLNTWSGVAMILVAGALKLATRQSTTTRTVHLFRNWAVTVSSSSRISEEIDVAERVVEGSSTTGPAPRIPLAA